MKIETVTYIEVENEPNIWAIELHECEERMKPVAVKFAMIHNVLGQNLIYVDCLLTDTKPEKIIPGVNGSISENFIEVGCWRTKKQEYSLGLPTPPNPWEYGILNDIKARRNKYTGEVQFRLWRAGEQGHKEDFYIVSCKSLFSVFKPNIVKCDTNSNNL